MGGSGNKRIIITDLERAEEEDILRAESFLAADSHELARHQVNLDIRGAWYSNPGVDAVYTAVPAGGDVLVAHDCLRGLMVRPDNATALGVDPGEGAFFAPAYPNLSADDSPYIAVKSAGLAVPNAVLTFLTNAGPGVRWDIVECQPTEVVTEQDTRGIYNPGTQSFAPTLVDKVAAGQLTFRIRRGVQGAGVPDIDPLWMPLAAVHVRADSTGFLDSDVYDLRPLVSERCPWSMRHPLSPPVGGTGYRMVLAEAELEAVTTGGIAGFFSRGYFRGHFGGYWSGGTIQKNMPAANLADFGATGVTGGSFDGFNWADTKNRNATPPGGANALLALGAFFPRGYPRWVRYSQAALTPNTTNRLRVAGRLPQGSRGILMATLVQPLRNGMFTPQSLPAAFGETAPAWGHAVGGAIYEDLVGTNSWRPAIGGGNGQRYAFPVRSAATGFTAAALLAAATLSTTLGTGASIVEGSVQPGTNVPAWARAILVRIDFTVVTDSSGNFVEIREVESGLVNDANPFISADYSAPRVWVPAGTANQQMGMTVWLPLWPAATYDGGGGSTWLRVIVGHASGGFVTNVTNATCFLLGFES